MASQRIPFVFGSIPARFESDFSLEESMERLQAAVQSSIFHAMFEHAMFGKVSESKVSLQRVIPLVGNSFKPFFRGYFHEEGNRVILDGKFTVYPLIKVFLGLWLALAGAFAVAACVEWFRGDPDGIIKAVVGLAMIGFFVALIGLGQWFARNDVAWLSSRIAEALRQRESCAKSVAAQQPSHSRPLWVAEGLLGLGALLFFLSAATGIQIIQTTPNGVEITYHSPLGRVLSGFGGIALAGLVYGVHQRAMIVWKIGMVGLPLGGILASAQILFVVWNGPVANQPDGMRWFVLAFVTLGAIAVTAYWSFWWFKQRRHFVISI
jgi:hypothetical protein